MPCELYFNKITKFLKKELRGEIKPCDFHQWCQGSLTSKSTAS